ncbi:MAG: RNA polymerase sigma factor [Planctomycetes bacterium]|nr:RNA polymerase sigma factor [Planctomycetota bacterium]
MMTIDSSPGREFERHTTQIYGWAYRLLGRHHDALDVVQDVFLRWDAQCLRETPKQPRGWLRRVTVNRAIDLRRQRRESVDPRTCDESAGRDENAMRMDQDSLRADIALALDGLSSGQRGVLIAKIYDDMTFREIATELELALSTVKTHYLRAIRALRDRLEPRWAQEKT